MCLLVNKRHWLKKPKITLFPKKVYKTFRIYHDPDRIETPYQHFPIDYNILVNGMQTNLQKMPKGAVLEIWHGIHAFRDYQYAVEQYAWRLFHGGDYITVEMIIPPFTKYWLGTQCDICAEKMLFSNEAKSKLVKYIVKH